MKNDEMKVILENWNDYQDGTKEEEEESYQLGLQLLEEINKTSKPVVYKNKEQLDEWFVAAARGLWLGGRMLLTRMGGSRIIATIGRYGRNGLNKLKGLFGRVPKKPPSKILGPSGRPIGAPAAPGGPILGPTGRAVSIPKPVFGSGVRQAAARHVAKASKAIKAWAGRNPKLAWTGKLMAEVAAFQVVWTGLTSLIDTFSGADEEQIDEGTALIKDNKATMDQIQQDMEQGTINDTIEKHLGDLKRQNERADDIVKKVDKKIITTGGRRLRGARKLRQAGYGKQLKCLPLTCWKEIYDEFYTAIEKRGLTKLLGRAGTDYVFGPKHREALAAVLKSKTADKAERGAKPALPGEITGLGPSGQGELGGIAPPTPPPRVGGGKLSDYDRELLRRYYKFVVPPNNFSKSQRSAQTSSSSRSGKKHKIKKIVFL